MGKLSSAINKLKKLKENRAEDLPISEDSALEQIVEILDYYDIPFERLEEERRTEKAGDGLLESLIKYFRRGQLSIHKTENGILNVIQTTQSGSTITYVEIKAKHKKVMDKYGDEVYKRSYAFLGSLCGLGSDAIEQLKTGGKQNDLACAEILGFLFLLV